MQKQDTVILMASSRSDGNTAVLADKVATATGAAIVNINEYEIRPYCYQNHNQDDGFMALIDTLLKFPNIIFASPVYWYGPSAQLKLFFDRITDLLDAHKDKGRSLRGKRVALLATGYDVTPKSCFEDVFAFTFEYLGMNYQGMLYVPFQERLGIDSYLSEINEFSQCIGATQA